MKYDFRCKEEVIEEMIGQILFVYLIFSNLPAKLQRSRSMKDSWKQEIYQDKTDHDIVIRMLFFGSNLIFH